jgi:hypothetical protein
VACFRRIVAHHLHRQALLVGPLIQYDQRTSLVGRATDDPLPALVFLGYPSAEAIEEFVRCSTLARAKNRRQI